MLELGHQRGRICRCRSAMGCETARESLEQRSARASGCCTTRCWAWHTVLRRSPASYLDVCAISTSLAFYVCHTLAGAGGSSCQRLEGVHEPGRAEVLLQQGHQGVQVDAAGRPEARPRPRGQSTSATVAPAFAFEGHLPAFVFCTLQRVWPGVRASTALNRGLWVPALSGKSITVCVTTGGGGAGGKA